MSGYRIVKVHDECWQIIIDYQTIAVFVQNNLGHAKRFKTEARARAYARKHAELALNHKDQVPGWK